MIAYSTPSGDVVVADSSGANPKVIGSGAVANAVGLAPLAWRRPASDAVTYVRNDGALVSAPIDGSAPTVLATDAAVPPDAEPNIISWELTGTFVNYIASASPGRYESVVLDFSGADKVHPVVRRVVGNPDQRHVIEQFFAPLDPFMVERTTDRETGREFTVALVEPLGGTILAMPYTMKYPTMSPDGRWAFGVSSLSGIDQLVRIGFVNPFFDSVYDAPRICHPALSPDAKQIVFAAGAECEQVWVIDANGGQAKQLSARKSGTATFEVGNFSWSLDGKTVSHPYCERRGEQVVCGGKYWDIATDGTAVAARAAAGNVVREQRALLRPIKVHLQVSGAIDYDTVMEVAATSSGEVINSLRAQGDQAVAKAVDESDISRDFELELYHPKESEIVSGTLGVRDGDTRFTIEFFGRGAIASYGYAKFRGVWTNTSTFPMKSGVVVITIER